MKDRQPLPALVGATFLAATLCTLMVSGGWLVWAPTLFALFVVGVITRGVTR